MYMIKVLGFVTGLLIVLFIADGLVEIVSFAIAAGLMMPFATKLMKDFNSIGDIL